jgi:hypothetical protein
MYLSSLEEQIETADFLRARLKQQNQSNVHQHLLKVPTMLRKQYNSINQGESEHKDR